MPPNLGGRCRRVGFPPAWSQEPFFIATLTPGSGWRTWGAAGAGSWPGLAGRGFGHLTGLDLNPMALAEAHKSLNKNGVRVPLVCGGLHSLPFPAASFDGALLMAVLTVLPSAAARDRALGEAARVLAPGGRIYLADFARNHDLPLYWERYQEGQRLGLEPGQFPVRGPDGRTQFLARHFTDQELEDMLTRAGFRVLGSEQPAVVTRTGNAVRGQVWVGEKV